MDNVWFDGWESLFRIICVTPLAYFSIVIMMRVSGKRSLAKMNAYDWIVTIALGSLLASVSLSPTIPLANGVTALLTFIGIQFIFTFLAVRFKAVRNLITNSPTLIFYKGEFLYPSMKKERITVEDILSAARQKGISTLNEIDMIILETTGDLAIIENVTTEKETTLQNVEGKPDEFNMGSAGHQKNIA